MISPQRENGYTAIANELMEALAGIRISGEARQCLDVILRKTYGFNKKEDRIALSQFSLITHLGKSHICRNLNKLAIMNIIITQKGNEYGKIYRFNKDYSSWKPLPKKVIITQKGNASLPKKGTTITTTTKDTYIPDFLEFWNEYPKKIEKPEAMKEWSKLKPDTPLKEKIIQAVKTWKNTKQWKEEGGKFIIYPARFLKRRKWEDEILSAKDKLWNSVK